MSSLLLCNKCGHTYLPKIQLSVFEKVQAYSVDHVDRATVAALAAEADAELLGYDLQIKDMEEIMVVLKEEREKALNHRNRCRNLISAVRRVPPETWLEIFGFACLEDRSANQYPGQVASQNPVARISGVCSQWRAICLSTPALWTSFIVDLRERHVTSHEFLEMHRERSCPLNISIRVRFPDYDDLCEDCRESEHHDWDEDPHFLPTVCSCDALRYLTEFSVRISSFRFKGLEISTSAWVQMLEAQQRQPLGFPNLETLELGSGERYNENGEEIDLGVFAGAVNLRHLSLSAYTGALCPPFWTQLRTVCLNHVEISVIHHLLSQCPSLTDADISPIIPEWPPELSPCVVGSLVSLKLYPSTSALLTSLTLPSLQSLEAKGKVDPEDILALAQRSSFPLRHISLQGNREDKFEIWEKVFLALPTTICSFKFSGAPVWREFLQHLTFSPKNERLVFPRLAKFEVLCEDSSFDDLVSMIESRCEPRSPFVRPTDVIIHVKEDSTGRSYGQSAGPLDLLVMAKVKKLSTMGLNISTRRAWYYII
ncbi:hypothetical protein C8J56DRAFT_249156 [Mycena floridula]|nr:hypothetical protein C8J56DRAFT_249156 [Mycena floridula]